MNGQYEFEITQRLKGTDCAEKFDVIPKLLLKYTIVKLKDLEYAIVEKNTNKCVLMFQNMVSVSDNIYLALISNTNTYVLIQLDKYNTLVFSEEFKKVIKSFKDFLLVETLEGQRRLVYVSNYSESLEFATWFEGMPMSGATDHAIMTCLDGNKVILLKENLVYSETEFKHIESQFTGKGFRIVHLGKEQKRAVIRIPSLEESKHFTNIRMMGTCFQKKDYVYVNDNDTKGTAIMRISDFAVSKFYAKVLPIADNYALIKENEDGPEAILRLSDFSVAEFN